ncbi:hypothetical protein AO826_18425 [Xanthomonas phaseoli pv. manihotis]|nr:hypothetical protein AO826_18425 [Xanthomonas phaseoli pv. manihotis]
MVGWVARLRMRAPMITQPGWRLAAASRRGKSAALCWPSPSMVITARMPSRCASAKPLRSAAPLPMRCG